MKTKSELPAPSRGQSLVAMAQEAARVEQLLYQMAEANLGELDEQLLLYLDTIESGITSKVDPYKFVLDALDKAQAQLKAQEEQFYRARKAVENFESRMKDRIKTSMQALETTELVGHAWRFKLATSQSALVVEPGAEARLADSPRFWKTIPAQTVLDKDAIKSALLSGEQVPGAYLEKRYQLRQYVNQGEIR